MLNPGHARADGVDDNSYFAAVFRRICLSECHCFDVLIIQFEIVDQIVADHGGSGFRKHLVFLRVSFSSCMGRDYDHSKPGLLQIFPASSSVF